MTRAPAGEQFLHDRASERIGQHSQRRKPSGGRGRKLNGLEHLLRGQRELSRPPLQQATLDQLGERSGERRGRDRRMEVMQLLCAGRVPIESLKQRALQLVGERLIDLTVGQTYRKSKTSETTALLVGLCLAAQPDPSGGTLRRRHRCRSLGHSRS